MYIYSIQCIQEAKKNLKKLKEAMKNHEVKVLIPLNDKDNPIWPEIDKEERNNKNDI